MALSSDSRLPFDVLPAPTRHLPGAVRRAARVAAPLAVAAALMAPVATAYAAPAAQPTIADVQAKLDTLAKQSAQLTEQYNTATIDVQAKDKAASDATAAAGRAVADYNTARGQLTQTVTDVYEGSSFGSTGALLLSNSGADYVDSLNTLGVIGAHQGDLVQELDAKKATADAATKKAADLLAAAKTTQAKLAKQRTDVQASITTYQATLTKLNAAQQAAYEARNAATAAQVQQARQAAAPAAPAASRGSGGGTVAGTGYSVHAGSGAAQIAVNFALAQIGKPYVFAASGPGSYDCSGLTMASWRAAGVSLPHSAALQYNYGTHVSVSQLQPGDLLFYYSPIGHVTIYAGNGMMVSAPQTGEDVKLMPVSAMMGSFVGATHIG